eukprot:scaffold285_cov151-Skeletonema_marinoi.AAC.4
MARALLASFFDIDASITPSPRRLHYNQEQPPQQRCRQHPRQKKQTKQSSVQMGVTASRYDGSSSKQQHRFAAATRRRSSSSSSSIIRRNSNSHNKMSSFNRNKNSPTLKNGSTRQATLMSGEDVTMQSTSKRIPLENITNDDDDVMEAEELPKTRKGKSSRGRKTVLLSPNKGNSAMNNTTLPSFLQRGAASSKADEEIAVAAASTAAPSKKESKQHQPIDPPGAIWNPMGNMYGMDAASFQQPGGGFSMPLWQPPPHHEDSNSGGRSWAVPPFLAPLAATVRHPFSHFVPNGQGHFSYWQQQQQQHQHQGGNSGEEFGMPLEEAEMEAETRTRSFTAADATMKEEDDDVSSIESKPSNKVDIPDVPSTFAPQECIDKIRAKLNAGQEVQQHVVQTRSMTAKSRSTKKSSKQKVAPIAAHQAKSPPSIKGKVPSPATTDDTAVEVMTVLGKTVHMVDPDRKVFVIDLLSPETCDEIRMMADNHTRNAKKDAEVWRTLYTYTKMDLPVVEGKTKEKRS